MQTFARDIEYIVTSFDQNFPACKLDHSINEAHHTFRVYCTGDRVSIPSILPEQCESAPEFTPECDQVGSVFISSCSLWFEMVFYNLQFIG